MDSTNVTDRAEGIMSKNVCRKKMYIPEKMASHSGINGENVRQKKRKCKKLHNPIEINVSYHVTESYNMVRFFFI